MIVTDNLISYIKPFVILLGWQGTFPITFYTNQQVLKVKNEKLKWEILKANEFTVFISVLWAQLILHGRHFPLDISIESLVFAICFSCFGIAKWTIFMRRESIAELFNLFVEFEKRNLTGKYYCQVFIALILLTITNYS